jgi:thymidylate synthase
MHPLFVSNDALNFMNGSIKVDSIASAYAAALKNILYNGIDFKDERGDKMKVFYNMTITIKRPLEDLNILDQMNRNGFLPYNRAFLDDYANQLIYGEKPKLIEKTYYLPKDYGIIGKILSYFSLNKTVLKIRDVSKLTDRNLGFAYTYFERLRKGKIDQIEEAIQTLIRKPNTRRAACTTWIPLIDSKEENCPCLNWLVFYNIYGKLYLTVGFRSHDIYGAYVENLYGIARLLEYVAKRSNLKIGALTVVSINGHYNKLFESEVKRIVGRQD